MGKKRLGAIFLALICLSLMIVGACIDTYSTVTYLDGLTESAVGGAYAYLTTITTDADGIVTKTTLSGAMPACNSDWTEDSYNSCLMMKICFSFTIIAIVLYFFMMGMLAVKGCASNKCLLVLMGIFAFLFAGIPPILWVIIGHPAFKNTVYQSSFRGKVSMGMSLAF